MRLGVTYSSPVTADTFGFAQCTFLLLFFPLNIFLFDRFIFTLIFMIGVDGLFQQARCKILRANKKKKKDLSFYNLFGFSLSLL
jgi:hypothetical protein